MLTALDGTYVISFVMTETPAPRNVALMLSDKASERDEYR
jgi:hypothetical protein